jgi:hypothetical protein
MLKQVSLQSVPNYVRAVTVLEPEGNVAAEVVDACERARKEIQPTGPDVSAKRWSGKAIIALALPLMGTLAKRFFDVMKGLALAAEEVRPQRRR